MKWTRVAGALFFAIALCDAGAQPRARVVLRGNVVDRGSEKPLEGAEVTASGASRSVYTNANGDFVLPDVPRGAATVVVRRLGYRAYLWRAVLPDADTATVDIALEIAPRVLDTVAVRASNAPPVPRHMEQFEAHRALGLGTFITEDALRAREHSSIEDVLRLAPGLRYVRLPLGGTAIASMIPPSPTLLGFIRGWVDGGPYPTACYVQVLVNGMRTWTWGRTAPLDITSFSVTALEGIEVFRHDGQTPLEYGGVGSSCGTVSLWMRGR